jgi:hypothetical protein
VIASAESNPTSDGEIFKYTSASWDAAGLENKGHVSLASYGEALCKP